MRILYIVLLTQFFCASLLCQNIVSGIVKTKKGEPIVGANVYFKGSFEGTTTNISGFFKLEKISETSNELVVSFLGYKTHYQVIDWSKNNAELEIVLLEDDKDIGEIIISAGAFAAGDKNKSAVLNTLDMATGSGGFGDIAGSLLSLPGTSSAADEGGLMVRGGERYETVTFIDGLTADDAFSEKLPSVPVRGRFSPMLFHGTVFSTGGYSAEYGQTLSSALILNTVAIPKKSETFMSLNSTGAYFSMGKKYEHKSFSATTSYNNMQPIYALFNSSIKWRKAPESINQNIVYRQKLGKTGMLKTMAAFNYDRSKMYYNNLDTKQPDLFSITNPNYFILATFNNKISKNWIFNTGLTAAFNISDININDSLNLKKEKLNSEFKLALSGVLSKNIKLNVGSIINTKDFAQEYLLLKSSIGLKPGFVNTTSAIFTEFEIKISKRFLSRIGGRFENYSLSDQNTFAPRFSLAYKPTKYSQFSVGYGEFYQNPQNEYFVFNNALKQEEAQHYILNYQLKRSSRIFRIEAYHKNYNNLIKYDSLYAINASSYNNLGHGYVNGIDVFLRDNKTIKDGDFWVSYSFMDSKRNYLDFTKEMVPSYLTRHNLSVAYKQYLKKADSFVSFGYNYSSGRPYVNPNLSFDVQQKTKGVNSISCSIFHFAKLFGFFTMYYAQVSHTLGSNTNYGYRFSKNADNNGVYNSEPILPVSQTFLLMGIHFSLTGQTEI